ncbi:hypothetical protein [Bradyrhizobium prioriisuperbiae]|uniref:hypothetical protein n=1 Tax=Bradyrhizobium prioriisuperbiae TaxID=2854389 RepID=UPI0028EBBB69|nr:hypothetical protein [Bradyrhizobium prioritasuperba]
MRRAKPLSSIDQRADLNGSFVSSDQDPLPKFDILAIRPSPEQIAQALATVNWIDLRDKTVVLISSFGDVFFEARDGIHLLSTVDGSWQKFAHNRTEFRRRLSFTGPDEFLFASLVSDARKAGMQLAPGECYDFLEPLPDGGNAEIANLRKINFVQKLNALRQWRPPPPPPPAPINPIFIVPVLLFLLPVLLSAGLIFAIPMLVGIHAIGVGAGWPAYLLTRAIATRFLKRTSAPDTVRWLATGLGIVAWVSTTIGVWFLLLIIA